MVALKFAFDSTQPGQSAAGRAAMEKPAEVFFYQVEPRTAAATIKKHFIFRHITQLQLRNAVHLRFLFFYEGLERDGATCDNDNTAGAAWGILAT